MKILVNGEPKHIQENVLLSEYILTVADQDTPCAVAVNGEFIPRHQHLNYVLQDGDDVEIVSPVGGG